MTTFDDDNLTILERLAGGVEASCPQNSEYPRREDDTPFMAEFMAKVEEMAAEAGLEIKPDAPEIETQTNDQVFDPRGMA